jgi:hypothetical protein
VLDDRAESLALGEIERVEVAVAQTKRGLERDVQDLLERLGAGDRA